MGDSYIIQSSQLYDLISSEVGVVDADDFSGRLMVGWNKTANKLYIAAQIRDDVHQIDRPVGSA
ncbi:MAG: hypothetical protein ACJ0UT_03515, partial [Candidatus Latescibacterota bacterium]